MANLKSSKKDIRRAEKRRDRNSKRKSAIRTFAKSVLKSVKAGKKEDAMNFYKEYSSLIDKAAKNKIIHKKTADRSKSRLSKKIAGIKN
ncbi:MAG TPA: 30S ribosomal protein S20 [Leptospiraceae bacterium]|nr:30S ribosomal protein S20 [Leptospiraceae bacterium]HMW06309.1 30S ribosomal protein S20 [Leptospiraceae bacterium]HMX31012.1 30S ribosomal protein S20 [Leptospiraceae bacterium]HMY32169.1 30S ribosomal protein S20 [Leptospiraceae bacterium]HMZ65102.1 30S ribosomal protein S20 [Leptospiraceae bacterium]